MNAKKILFLLLKDMERFYSDYGAGNIECVVRDTLSSLPEQEKDEVILWMKKRERLYDRA